MQEIPCRRVDVSRPPLASARALNLRIHLGWSLTRGMTGFLRLFLSKTCQISFPNYIFVEYIDKWIKLRNQTPQVCFGAKHNQFGRFWIPFTGFLVRVKLVHLSGLIRCSQGTGWFNWGCIQGKIHTVITNSSDSILLPRREKGSILTGFEIPGYFPTSPQLVFPDIQPRLSVVSGQEMRIWNTEDLLEPGWTGDNFGSVCVDVYVMINLW